MEDLSWRRWLNAFVDLPDRDASSIDWYTSRLPPFLARMPDPALLPQPARSSLRDAFKDYAFDLGRVQKKADVRELVDVVGIVGGVFVGNLPGFIFGTCVLIRNRLANQAWKRRMRDLERLAKWIKDLV